jgi:DNA-binding beta-propeller fold protein YncE
MHNCLSMKTTIRLKPLLLVIAMFAITCPGQKDMTVSTKTVLTIAGDGVAGYSAKQVNNPYGLVIGPDGALYFCDLDNQRIRRLDLNSRELTTIAGNGQKGYAGDGGPALQTSLNMPHELRFDHAGDLFIVERDNHTIRKINRQTGVITTVAGTGVAGFSGDGGLGIKAQLRSPHSIAFDAKGALLICDIGNNRVRRLDPKTGIIETYAGTGERKPTPDGAPLSGTPLNGPRTIAVDRKGNLSWP